jgi:hypothetical protein
MTMIYHAGLGGSFNTPLKIELVSNEITSFEVKKLKNWKSPNLIINFNGFRFEQPTPLIVNYESVIKFLNSRKLKR